LGGRRRSRRCRGRRGIRVRGFWRRSIGIKWVLRGRVLGGSFRRGISGCLATGGRVILGASRKRERDEKREQEPQFHNFIGRSLHRFYFNASGLGSATHFPKANCQTISDPVEA